MYQVLYRKWRPKTFSDVVGQQQTTVTLANEIMRGNISHAYLFTGTRGTGKTTCARILAKALCCEHPVNGDPCNECNICRAIDDGSLMDIVEIDAASNRSIEDIKLLKEKSSFLPTVAKYRIYIIDEVHMLSTDAFNALLKLIEEPPEHLIFIFATTEIHKVLPTIQSRCQKFTFRRIDSDDIADRLEYVSRQEGRELTRGAALMIARISDGAMRDSLSLLDRCFVYEGVIDENTVTSAAGIMGRSALFELSDGILTGDSVKILRILEELHRESCDSERVCSELIEHFRNFLLVLSLKNPEDAVIATPADMEQYKSQAKLLTVPKALRITDVLCRTFERLKYSKTGRVELETALIRLCVPEADTDVEALLARIAELEKKLHEGVPVQVVSTPVKPKPIVQKKIEVAPEPPVQKPVETVPEPIVPKPQIIEEIPDIPPSFEDTFSDDIPMDDELMSFGDDIPMDDSPMPFGYDIPMDDSPMPFGDDMPMDDEPMIPVEPVKAPQHTENATFPEWNSVVRRAKELSPPLRGPLNGSRAVINGNAVLVSAANPMLGNIIRNPNFVRIIERATVEITGTNYTIKIL